MKRLAIPTLITIGLLLTGAAGASDSTSPHWRNAFDLVLKDYEAVRLALAGGTLDGVAEHAARMAAELEHLDANITARHAGVRRGTAVELHDALPGMIEAAGRLGSASSLGEARRAFLELSRGMVLWHGFLEKPHKAIVVTCPADGEVWLQAKRYRKTLANPYEPEERDRCTRAPQDS